MTTLLVILILAVAMFVAWKTFNKKNSKTAAVTYQEPVVIIEHAEPKKTVTKKTGAKRGPKKKTQN